MIIDSIDLLVTASKKTELRYFRSAEITTEIPNNVNEEKCLSCL